MVCRGLKTRSAVARRTPTAPVVVQGAIPAEALAEVEANRSASLKSYKYP